MCVGKTNHRDPISNQKLAQYSMEQAQRHKEHILPHEIAELEQLQDEGYQKARGAILSGRANADAAAAERAALEGLRGQSGSLGPGRFTTVGLSEGNIVSGSQDARSKGVMEGYGTGESMTMDDRLGALATGQGHTRGVVSGLATAARNEAHVNRARAAGEQELGRALGGLLTVAGVGGYNAAKRAMNSEIPTENLSLAGKGIRKIWGKTQAPQDALYSDPYGQGQSSGQISYPPGGPVDTGQVFLPGHGPQTQAPPQQPTSMWSNFWGNI